MSKRKTVIIVVLILLALAAGGAGYWFITNKNASSGGNAVFVQNVGDLTSSGTALNNRYSGIVETQKTEKVAFDTSKQLDELFVAEGDRVEAGAPLFSYDTSSIDLDIESAELEIDRLNTTIDNDKEQLKDLEASMKKAKDADKPAFAAQIKELQAEIAQTEYSIKTKERDIESLKATQDHSTVFAPISGTVTRVGDPANPGAPDYDYNGESSGFISILADGDLRVKGSISEQNIYEIGEGMPVIVRSRINPEQFWTGTVAAIETQTESSNENFYYGEGERASKYPFYINLDSSEELLLGQHVTIELDFGQDAAREGMWLSAGFIIQEEDTDSAYCWAAKEGGKLEKRQLSLGEYDPEMDEWQILSGLEATDFIAWPDVDCKEGAPTTTEYVFDEDEMDPGILPDGEEYYEDGGEGDYANGFGFGDEFEGGVEEEFGGESFEEEFGTDVPLEENFPEVMPEEEGAEG